MLQNIGHRFQIRGVVNKEEGEGQGKGEEGKGEAEEEEGSGHDGGETPSSGTSLQKAVVNECKTNHMEVETVPSAAATTYSVPLSHSKMALVCVPVGLM